MKYILLLMLIGCVSEAEKSAEYKCENGRLYQKLEGNPIWVRTSRGCKSDN